MSGAPPEPSARILRSLTLPVYLPTVLEAAGEAALLPVVPVMALHLGFSVPAAAALTLIAGVTAVLGPLPVGRLMGAMGARRAIIASGVLLACADLAALLLVGQGLTGLPRAVHRLGLVLLLVVMAATGQVWQLGRQSYLGGELPPTLRARGMSTFGGMLRVGQVVGPLLGAAVMALGHEGWVFGLFAALTTAATALVALFMVPGERRGAGVPLTVGDVAGEETAFPEARPADGTPGDGTPGDGTPGDGTPGDGAPGDGAPATTPAARPILHRMIVVGLGVTPIMMGRINRPVILPLIGAGLHLPATAISVVFGIAAVIEILLFLPAGAVMDRRGRAAVAVPCSLLMGLGFLALVSLVPTLGAASPTGALLALTLPSLLIALGNGLGSGIVMTLGLDVTPERHRTRYLAWWNTVIGVGRLTAPLLVSGIALIAPILASAAVSGALCLAGAWWLHRVLPGLTPGRR